MATESQGITLEWNTNAIGEVIQATGPGGSAAIIDTTHLVSTAVEKMISIPDEGQMTLDLNYLIGDVGQVALRADRLSGTVRACRLLMVDTEGTILTFNAYCMGNTVSAGVGQQVKGNVTLEISGGVDYSDYFSVDTAYNEATGVIVLDLNGGDTLHVTDTTNTANWTWDYGTSGLTITSVVRTTAVQATITYALGAEVAGTHTIYIQAKAAALTGSYPSGNLRQTITILP
jgi:hypothetical protein